ncbi:RHS repeat domain-containing protein [Streptomyces sp. NPDC001508]|uniref:RHS repeat domain-containing protein n=1 Tax=Streptomyces sp. NPDC001508 TaxID=3154656 RepID=UPI0033187FC5
MLCRKTASHGYDADSQLLTTTDCGGKTVTYTYDDAGNLSSETSPLGNQTTYAYDDNRRLITTGAARQRLRRRSRAVQVEQRLRCSRQHPEPD